MCAIRQPVGEHGIGVLQVGAAQNDMLCGQTGWRKCGNCFTFEIECHCRVINER
jgi:hypothetical protein